jgi:hypothetical protein
MHHDPMRATRVVAGRHNGSRRFQRHECPEPVSLQSAHPTFTNPRTPAAPAGNWQAQPGSLKILARYKCCHIQYSCYGAFIKRRPRGWRAAAHG